MFVRVCFVLNMSRTQIFRRQGGNLRSLDKDLLVVPIVRASCPRSLPSVPIQHLFAFRMFTEQFPLGLFRQVRIILQTCLSPCEKKSVAQLKLRSEQRCKPCAARFFVMT